MAQCLPQAPRSTESNGENGGNISKVSEGEPLVDPTIPDPPGTGGNVSPLPEPQPTVKPPFSSSGGGSAPTCQLTADNSSVVAGDPVTISIVTASDNFTKLTIENINVTLTRSRTFNPTTTTTYKGTITVGSKTYNCTSVQVVVSPVVVPTENIAKFCWVAAGPMGSQGSCQVSCPANCKFKSVRTETRISTSGAAMGTCRYHEPSCLGVSSFGYSSALNNICRCILTCECPI